MSTAAVADPDWKLPSIRHMGMIVLIITESALFTIFVVAYLFYKGKSLNGPYPQQVIGEFPLWGSLALWGSSVVIVFAERALHHGNRKMFHIWWGLVILMGAYFLYFTAMEWTHLITADHLLINTNVFGTTFYSLVGLHASHVVVGLVLLGTILVSSLRGKLQPGHMEHVEIISWYWHFVDAIWVVVVSVVYIYSADCFHLHL